MTEKQTATHLTQEDLGEIKRIQTQRNRISEQIAALQGVNGALEGQHKTLFRAIRAEYGITDTDRINGQTGEIQRNPAGIDSISGAAAAPERLAVVPPLSGSDAAQAVLDETTTVRKEPNCSGGESIVQSVKAGAEAIKPEDMDVVVAIGAQSDDKFKVAEPGDEPEEDEHSQATVGEPLADPAAEAS